MTEMFDPVGAAQTEGPILWHQGQPISREAAAEALTAFDADADKVKAALGGDIARQQERRDLWMLSRGHQPGAVPATPSDANAVQGQVQEREAAITEARLDTFAKHTRQTPEMRAQFKRRLATQDQHDYATAERARLLKDGNFRQRVLDGDADATDTWVRIVQAAAAPVAPAGYKWEEDKV
jgi:hypothetical protein